MSTRSAFLAITLSMLLVLALRGCAGDAAAAQGPGEPTAVSVGELVYSERGQPVGKVTHVLVERDRTRIVVEARR